MEEAVKIELSTTSPTDSEDRVLFSLRMVMVILCFSVFAWGLHYKLSLYQNNRPVHPSNIAKLMQGEKKHGAAAVSAKWNTPSGPQYLIRWMVSAFDPSPAFKQIRQIGESVTPLFVSDPHVHFFRRPPPIF